MEGLFLGAMWILGKIFQAPPVSTKNGAAWLQTFLTTVAAPAFEALLDKPSIEHRAFMEPAAVGAV